jgi:tellurite resistance protein TehA-like permease
MTANSALESLHPGNFALVMATGIISIALKAMNHAFLASFFAYMAVSAWIVLMFLCTLRLIKFHKAVVIDLTSPRMVFSYFTLVAATDIVGMLALHEGYLYVAYACWGIAFVAWCLLLYLAFSVLTFMSHENNVNIMHGGWLITIVGTQSLVLLGSELATTLGPYAHYMLVEVHLLWGLGLALYGIFVTLFCYRIFFLALKPHDLSPLLWVVMGAGAISVNAGNSLLENPITIDFLAIQKPFINGITFILWSWATWWVPLLVLFGIWKHLVRGLRFEYEPTVWSMVFPLAMYSLASQHLGVLTDFPPMNWIAHIMIILALSAWAFSMQGLVCRMLSIVRGKYPSRSV